MARAVTKQSKGAASVPQVGALAPDFSTIDSQGNTVRLKDLRGQTVVLYFYPKDDTPGCTKQSCGFRDLSEEFRKHNAVIFGLSPDGEESHQKFRAKYELPFELLVDKDHKIAERYGAWGEKNNYGKIYQGVIRSHVVIGPDGRVLDARRNVKATASPDLALEALSE